MVSRYQGEFDGLCGPYAIANAFEFCGYNKTKEIFEIACSAIARNKWPMTLWEGTDFQEMKKMIRACKRNVKFTPEVTVDFPFAKQTPESNKEYWHRFNEIFSDQSVICGVVGLIKPDFHWIVVSRDSDHRLVFTDSTVGQKPLRKNRSSLYAGERRKNPNQWLIHREELVTFSIK